MMFERETKEGAGLKVLICGAGIGGFTAATALRRQGHHVTLLEQSRLSSETGAAIHVAPNAWGLLLRIGVDMKKIGANPMLGFVEYEANGQLKKDIDISGPPSEMWAYPWGLAHRQNLHSELRSCAVGEHGKGPPAKLVTSSKVVDVNTEAASVTLEDGTVYQADLVIGADGVHSNTRRYLKGGDKKPFGSSKSAWRFMVPKKLLLEDPRTASILAVEKLGRLGMWIGSDRRVVMYPCQDNQTLNFVAIHPTEVSEAEGSEWNQGGSMERMQECYKSFAPEVHAMFSHVDASTLKVWTLLDMEALPTYVDGKFAVIGDAAHPFLPHQGQGGAMAIEDGVALAAVLPHDTPQDEINERLKIYEKCRYERAHKVQEYTRMSGRDQEEVVKSGKPLNILEFTNYNFGHDAWDYARRMLRRWELDRSPNMYWRMPVSFGPAPGPRQDAFGARRNAKHSAFSSASIKFKTSRTYLESLLPSPSFSFASPGTVAFASISATTLDRMEWLGGSGYTHCGLYIHGVKYTKKDGEAIIGTFLAVLFESLTDPITTGREELGMPKLFCELHRGQTNDGASLSMSWKGTQFGSATWHGLQSLEPKPTTNGVNGVHSSKEADAQPGGLPGAPGDTGVLAYRYVPAVGERGKADAEYAVYVPAAEASEKPVIHKTLKASNASLSFDAGNWQTLPTLHHVAQGLADVPIFDVVEAKVVEGTGVEDVSQARRIE